MMRTQWNVEFKNTRNYVQRRSDKVFDDCALSITHDKRNYEYQTWIFIRDADLHNLNDARQRTKRSHVFQSSNRMEILGSGGRTLAGSVDPKNGTNKIVNCLRTATDKNVGNPVTQSRVTAFDNRWISKIRR